MCPFCYLGKRRFENALASLPFRDSVTVTWKSFQLNPDLKEQPDKDVYTYVAELKGQTREWSVEVHQQLVNTAREAGLDYRFDKAKIANSFNAHRLIQFAKTKGAGDRMEERLFKAYFTEGVLISDKNELLRLATETGLPAEETRNVLESTSYSIEVEKDEKEAARMGITGVPYFIIDRKLAVSGAQSEDTFREALLKAYRDKSSAH